MKGSKDTKGKAGKKGEAVELMGRKDKYEEYVAPRLEEIKKLVIDLTENQIAQVLGIAPRSFARYKVAHPELREALKAGTEMLVCELKDALRKKARGFTYKEKKVITKEEGGVVVSVQTEEYEKYAPPDTGAIHLLLKNYDKEWRNDDAATMELKRRTVETAEKKAEGSEWA